MCDYSLEMYSSRKAIAGEDLVLERFASGSKGFVAKAGDTTCVCCEPGMTMTLHLGEGDTDVTFATKNDLYKDGFMLSNGEFVLLQAYDPGMRATVIKPLPDAIVEAASATIAFEPEVRVEELVPLAPALAEVDPGY